jgi:hypothetical protein
VRARLSKAEAGSWHDEEIEKTQTNGAKAMEGGWSEENPGVVMRTVESIVTDEGS